MADLGAVGFSVGSEANAGPVTRELSDANQTSYIETPVNGLIVHVPARRAPLTSSNVYTISGTITENGSGVARRVAAFRRDTGLKIAETMSAGDGSYTLEILGFNGECSVIAFDDDAGTAYNALIYDRVIPS